MSANATCTGYVRIGVIGAGIAGSIVVHSLKDYIAAGVVSVTVFEIGRFPGGRATTRTSRDNLDLRIDHGTPAFVARSPSFVQLCEKLRSVGVLEHASPDGYGVLTEEGHYRADSGPEGGGNRYIGGKAGMGSFSDALLRGGQLSSDVLATCVFSTVVRSIIPIISDGVVEGWRLRSVDEALGDFDWLVVSSSAVAHPRWSQVNGGEPPLAFAASQLNDPILSAAVAEIAKVKAQPCIVVLLAFNNTSAEAWAALPFSRTRVQGNEVLRRVVVQRVHETLTTVALHSTTEFAWTATSTYGAKSAATRIGGAASDTTRERELSQALVDAVIGRLVPNLLAPEHVVPVWGPHLHRWGSAFPNAPHMPVELAHALDARVVFCGDFLAGPFAESVEGAALSGQAAAEALKAQLPPIA